MRYDHIIGVFVSFIAGAIGALFLHNHVGLWRIVSALVPLYITGYFCGALSMYCDIKKRAEEDSDEHTD